MNSCPICSEQIKFSSFGTRNVYSVECPRCSNYHITNTALSILRNTHLNDRQRANVSGWLGENKVFEITTENMKWLVDTPTPSFHERANKMLLALEQRTKFAGQYLNSDISWVGLGWCINSDELNEVLWYLESSARINKQMANNKPIYKILPNGWAQLENIKKVGSDSKQCFVAMWFDEQVQVIYDEAIAKGILDSGYKPHRVDQREYNDKIDDEIIAQIRRSRFIVADFTGT